MMHGTRYIACPVTSSLPNLKDDHIWKYYYLIYSVHAVLKHLLTFLPRCCHIAREWCVTIGVPTSVKMAGKKEQHVDPWTAEAAEGETSIDYNKLIGQLPTCHDHTSL